MGTRGQAGRRRGWRRMGAACWWRRAVTGRLRCTKPRRAMRAAGQLPPSPFLSPNLYRTSAQPCSKMLCLRCRHARGMRWRGKHGRAATSRSWMAPYRSKTLGRDILWRTTRVLTANPTPTSSARLPPLAASRYAWQAWRIQRQQPQQPQQPHQPQQRLCCYPPAPQGPPCHNHIPMRRARQARAGWRRLLMS